MNAPARTRIKICGITRVADAHTVADCGADAIGLNFSALSARKVSLAMAETIGAAVADRLTRVGLFVDPETDEVREVVEHVALDLLQFHGDEPQDFCASFGLPYMKVHRIADQLDLGALVDAYPDACAHLLDTFVAGQPGGTGKTFDWSLWPQETAEKLVLAGGLNPDNVAEAVRRTRPYAVDVAGGVEGPSKGVKSAERIRGFVAAVRTADAEQR